jgi:transcriptional regulator with XRE-family HTH domain
VSFGLTVRRVRQARNRDVEEVADAAGVRPYVLRRCEQGEPIPAAEREAIRRAALAMREGS